MSSPKRPYKEWTDEKILSEYERIDNLKLHSTLKKDEQDTYIEIVREMYFRRIGHYKDYVGPRTTGLDDKPYQEHCADETVLESSVDKVMQLLLDEHLTIRESNIVLGKAARRLIEMDRVITGEEG